MMQRSICAWCLSACLVVLCVLPAAVRAAEVRVAVAANFAVPFAKLAAAFSVETGHTTVVSSGSTGKFYAQIKAGAPFDVLLAADSETPKKLEDEGLAVKGLRFTYARGKLVLWTLQPGAWPAQATLAQVQGMLRDQRFKHLAIANPQLAPYGLAALDTLQAMQLHGLLLPRLVQGDNIAQAAQFVATGNAELGFVALSQVITLTGSARGSWWPVPEQLHRPLLQDAALLQRGAQRPAAHALMRFLQTDQARALIRQYGYDH